MPAFFGFPDEKAVRFTRLFLKPPTSNVQQSMKKTLHQGPDGPGGFHFPGDSKSSSKAENGHL
jgi:hypothetical protein